ncbi:MAG: BMP family ABC transporter substrate-binding protein [Oscillospiraceae bacterium]|nr:BMP family ABC transporter substrate-binding protein [Oscillospiraceae bacterium]
MKKIITLLLALVMMASLFTACGTEREKSSIPDVPDPNVPEFDGVTIKAGLVCIGDENDQGYTYNFIRGKDAATEELRAKGINVEWIVKYNLPEGDPVADANIELAEEGCAIIFNNSYGQEPAMLRVAPDYPDVHFVAFTNEGSWKDDLPNTHNEFAHIYEGRYLTGYVAGLKMQEMIDKGEIKPEEAIIGFVGAYSYAEVISGFTAYFLGARRACPSATMKVQFVGSWSDATAEANAAAALCDAGAIVISMHSDNTTPATTAESYGVFHTAYMNDMISVAPKASLNGCRIDFAPYFVHAIECMVNGTELEQDMCPSIRDGSGSIVLTPLNEDIVAEGTAEKLAELEQLLINGEVEVFDTSTFTVEGKEVTTCLAIDTDGDFAADSEEAVFDGVFHESYFQSAPYFALKVDGIEWLNAAY